MQQPDFNTEVRQSSPGMVSALSGWPLEAAVAIDTKSIGFLRETCRLSNSWKQSFSALVDFGIMEGPDRFLAGLPTRGDAPSSRAEAIEQVGGVLRSMTPREIIHAGMGSVPQGFIGALAKLGPEPLARGRYVSLFELFASSDPLQTERRRTILQLERLDEARLDIIEAVDPVLLVPSLIRRIRSIEQATQISANIALIRRWCSNADDLALRKSLTDSKATLTQWCRSWLLRADRPDPVEFGLESHPDWELVTTSNVRRVASEFRNCLESKLGKILSGVWVAAVYRPLGVICLFVRTEPHGWLFTGAHAPGNRFVSAEIVAEIESVILAGGEGWTVRAKTQEHLLPALELFHPLGHFDLDGDFD